MNATSIFAPFKIFFTFPFQDPENKNRFVVGAAVMLAGFFVPVLPMIFILGQMFQLMQHVARDGGLSLPAWDNWGKLFTDGLKLLALNAIVFLPPFVIYMGGMFAYFASFFSLMAAAENEVVFPSGIFLGFSVMMLAMFLSMILSVTLAIPYPAAAVHMAAEDRLGAAFEFRAWWAVIRHNSFSYFLVWLLLLGLLGLLYVGFMLAYTTFILCVFAYLFIPPVAYYIGLVANALFAEVYRTGAHRIGIQEESL